MAVTFDGSSVAAKSVSQESRNPADRCDTDAGHIVYATIGKISLQKANDLPTINQCL